MEKILWMPIHLCMGVPHGMQFVRNTCSARPEIPFCRAPGALAAWWQVGPGLSDGSWLGPSRWLESARGSLWKRAGCPLLAIFTIAAINRTSKQHLGMKQSDRLSNGERLQDL